MALSYASDMEDNRSLRVANLELDLGLLRKDEQRLQSIIAYPDTSPEYREQAQRDLANCLKRIDETAKRIAELERS